MTLETLTPLFIGVLGTFIGGATQILAPTLRDYYKTKQKKALEQKQKDLLETMLKNSECEWRKLTTLSNVVGCDEITTKRLLLEIGARGSETNPDTWGLISRNPLPSSDK